MTSDGRPAWETFLAAATVRRGRITPSVSDGEGDPVRDAIDRVAWATYRTPLDIRVLFDSVLGEMTVAAGLSTAPAVGAVPYPPALDGIETGIRYLRRVAPLETVTLALGREAAVTIPTGGEMLRVKAWLLATRNTTRDLVDVVALTDTLGRHASVAALATLDTLYPQEPAASVLQQVLQQLASPSPSDFMADRPLASEYPGLSPAYLDWAAVTACAAMLAGRLLADLPAPDGGLAPRNAAIPA